MAKLKDVYVKKVSYKVSKTSSGANTVTCRVTIPAPIAEFMGIDTEAKKDELIFIVNQDDKSVKMIKK